MQKKFLSGFFVLAVLPGLAQETLSKAEVMGLPTRFTVEKTIAATPVKNQAITGTCWCFSTVSLVESQCLRKNLGTFDISEMFEVRNIYIEKAKNYILRQGHTQFGEGGLGHDLIRAIVTYGAVPEAEYSGLKGKEKNHNHMNLVPALKKYLDSILNRRPVPLDWIIGYTAILDRELGAVPSSFTYRGNTYTPKTFATEVLKFDPGEYVNITSFTHHPYYAPFVLEVPDNFSNGAYYNIPLNEMMQLTRDALRSGYTVMWDADVSNDGFMQKMGVAIHPDTVTAPVKPTTLRAVRERALRNQQAKQNQPADGAVAVNNTNANPANKTEPAKANNVSAEPVKEGIWDAELRQDLFENLTTQDDHLMHITGITKTPDGKSFFQVKNSWGEVGPGKGYINVSEAYFAINTISLIVPKAALSKPLLDKLGIK